MPRVPDIFKDKRISRKHTQVQALMSATNTCVVNKMTANASVRESIYRFFLNQKVTVAILISLLMSKLSKILGIEEELLCISDTTEINYESKRNRIKDQREIVLT